MRLCVPGNSASAANGLSDKSKGWPWLVGARVQAALGEPVEVHHFTVFPVGPRAAAYTMARVEELAPDVVVVPLGTYACAIRTVEEGVRRRFGQRAASLYKRVERAFERRTRAGADIRARLNRPGRDLARRILGTAAVASVADVVEAYNGMLHGLSQREGIHVVVLAEPHWPEWIARSNHGSMEAWAAVLDGVRPVALGHHFTWLESTLAFASVPDRDALYQPDGVHKTELGYRIQAELVLEALVGADGLLAEQSSRRPRAARS